MAQSWQWRCNMLCHASEGASRKQIKPSTSGDNAGKQGNTTTSRMIVVTLQQLLLHSSFMEITDNQQMATVPTSNDSNRVMAQ